MLLLYFLILLNNKCILLFISFTIIYSCITTILSKLQNSIIYKNCKTCTISKIISKIPQFIKTHYFYDALLIYLSINISISNFNIISKLPTFKNSNNGVLFVNAQLTSEQKDALLYLHRKTRDAVGATNMQTLYWSSSLASKAQAYAEKCVGLSHSGVMGENLATATYNDVERLYHLWEDERELFEQSDSYRKKFPGYHSFGHYTQIVWAANTEVGCGQAYCKNLSQPYNLVCRYALGNIIDFEVYSFSTTEVVIPNIAKKGSGEKESEPTSNNDDSKKTGTSNRNGSGSSQNKGNTNSNSNTSSDKSSNSKTENENKSDDSTKTNTDNSTENIDTNGNDNGNEDGVQDGDEDENVNNDNNKDSTEDASVGDGVNVVAKDDGKGGVILVVLGGTAASGAFALMYVKKKKPDQYKKLCRQISTQQKEITKITKRLTVKVGNGTSTLGRKIIERSKSSATLGRHFRGGHTFKHSKSNNDIRINLSDDFDLPYKFNLNNYSDLDTNDTIKKEIDLSNNYNFYSKENKKSRFSFASLRPKSYRKLSYSTINQKKDEYPQANKAIPVPKYDVDIIEKMNNLDKYEQFITQSKASSTTDASESRPLLKSYQSPLMRDRKGSDSCIDYYSNNRNSNRSSLYSHGSTDTTPLINRYTHDNDNNPSKIIVIDQSIQPPLPTRFKSNTRNRSCSQSSNLTKSPSLRPSHRYQRSDTVVFPRRKRSLSQSSNKSKSPALKPYRYQEPETVVIPQRERSMSIGSNGSSRGRKRFIDSESPSRHRGRSSSSSRSRSDSSRSRSRSHSRSRSRSRSPHSYNRNNRRPSTPSLKSSPSPQFGQPERMKRKNSLNARKPRPGHEPTLALNRQRSPSYSNIRQTEQNLQSDEYHNLVLNDLLESYN